MNVAYGCCVGSDEKLRRYVLPRLPPLRLLYAQRDQTSIAVAYNQILDDAREDGVEVLILQHDDLEITDPRGEDKLVAAAQLPTVALAGVAGGGGAGLAWWNQSPIGHQKTDTMDIDFGQREGFVTLLEGSLLAFGPWAIKHLRFDERFPGFHGYDEIARQACAQNKLSAVVDVDTWHHNPMGFKSEASHQEWLDADRMYREKWGL